MFGMIRRLRITSFVDFYLLFMAFMIPWQTYTFVRRAITAFHVINVFFLIVFLLKYFKKLHWFYALPAILYLFGSFLGMFNSEFLSLNIYTIGLDIYLYVWFAVMCVLLNSSRRVECLMVAWAITLILVLGTEGLGLIGGEKRLEFSFRNPNRAASYFGLSLFFLLHPVIPWIFKSLIGAALLMAISSTGSVAGLLMIPIGVVVFAWAWSYVRAGRALRPLQHLAWGIIVVFCIYANFYWIETGTDSTGSIVSTLSPRGGPRMEEGTSDRMEIWSTGIETFREHPFGIGPASFQWQVGVGVDEDTKGMHSDFVASLVERGIVGFLGFMLLLGAVARTVMKMLRLSARDGDRARGFWAACLAGALAAYVSYGTTHEMLHHETFWLLLALIVSYVGVLQRDQFASVVRVLPQNTVPLHPSSPYRRRLRVG
jgi:O-antigen ligase